MGITFFGIFKALRIQDPTDRTKQLNLEISPSATTNTSTTLVASQTANRTISLPDASDTLITASSTDTFTNKTFDADGTGNVLLNVDDTNIKALAGINATKIADGSVTNTEFQFINSLTSNAQDQLNSNGQAISDHIADPTDAHDASAISNVPAGTIAATDVQAAINELDGDVQQVASDLSAHINDATDAHDGSAISNIPSGNLSATDVQGALNELQTDVDTRALDSALTAHINDATDAHDASAISNVPSGNLSATDVQGALNELQTDVDTRVTTASNIGAGTGQVFKQKTVSTLELKTLLAGSNITITNNTDDITIASSGGGGSSGVFVVYAMIIGNQNLASGPVTIDGIVGPPNGSLILVAEQSAPAQNGVYTFNGTGVAMTRATGWTTAGDFTAGRQVYVQNGSFRSDTLWTLTSTVTTLGTDPVSFQLTGFNPRALPVVNIVPRIANGSVLGTTTFPFDSLIVGGNSGVTVYTTASDQTSWRKNLAGSLGNGGLPYTGTQNTIFTNSALSFFITSLNSNSVDTTPLGIYTGRAVGASNSSGSIDLVTGPVSGTGDRGFINMAAAFLLLPKASADPTNAALVSGAIYYNTSTNKIKMYNGTTWETVTSV